jgi:hypothetical protein
LRFGLALQRTYYTTAAARLPPQKKINLKDLYGLLAASVTPPDQYQPKTS